jgi:hypothetical protein
MFSVLHSDWGLQFEGKQLCSTEASTVQRAFHCGKAIFKRKSERICIAALFLADEKAQKFHLCVLWKVTLW